MCSLGLWFGLDSANGSPARDQRMGKKGRVIDSSALFPARAPEAGYAPHWRSPPSHQNSLFPGSTGASSCIPLRATNPGNCPAPCSPSTPSYTLRNTSFIVNHLLWLCTCFPLGSKDIKEIIKLNINMIIFNIMRFPSGSYGKESTCNAEDPGSIPGLERPPGRSHSSILAW